MKKVALSLGAIALLSLIACKDKVTNAIKITTAASVSSQVDTKMKEAKDRWAERKAKGDTLALPYKDLEAYLPDINGYTKPDGAKGSQINVPGAGGWSQVEQDYVNGDKKVTVGIFDYNSSQQSFMGVTAIYSMGYSFEDDTKKQAPADLRVSNVAAYETLYKKEKKAEMAVVVADRFLITIRSDGDGDEDFIQSVARDINLGGLASK
jgi:hypothetical protein